jgi:hypothetical protein
MAMFQQYQSGIQPVTGMSEAGANIGRMYESGLSNLGKGLAEGIKAYNDNSAKNELANAKIQSLSQDVANKIAMYSQDPEIAQSGVLEGLMQTAATLQDAPTKGLSQRLGLVHDAEAKLAGFGQQLQEWSFLRGRQIERGISDALRKFAGTVTTTESIDVNDPMFNVNPNETITQTKDRLFKILGEVKKLNPNAQINNDEFYSRWLSKAEQEVANAKDIDPRIISAQLEAIQAEKSIQKQNRLAQGMTATDIPSGEALNLYLPPEMQEPQMNTVKDYEAMMARPSEAPVKAEKQKQDALEKTANAEFEKSRMLRIERDKAELDAINKQIEAVRASDAEGNRRRTGFITGAGKATETGAKATASWYANRQTRNAIQDWMRQTNIDTSKMTDEQLEAYMRTQYREANTFMIQALTELSHPLSLDFASTLASETGAAVKGKRSATFTAREEAAFNKIANNFTTAFKLNPTNISSLEERKKVLERNVSDASKQKFLVDNKPKTPVQEAKPVPTIAVGDVVVGTQERARPLTVSEKKSQVQDFLTQRFGAIDPTDPTGKRRIPVQGFDQFFAKAVPESEIREFTTEGGTRLLQINGKWEQVKAPERPSIQDVRKERIGVFGQQTADGRLVPTEFVEGSGIYLGGLYRGTDAGADKFTDEITQLIDARRGVKRLQEINDKFGEALSLKDSGEAAVEVMNLKAALRTDIIGVGTVSNFEQALIDKVIKDPTEFLSMEPRDRAILLALANRIDRRIKNISSSRGLTVQIRDTGNKESRYDDLRQRYLREKGLL